MIPITDLIVRMQPYSKGLKNVIKNDTDFATALKVNNPRRFISFGAIIVSNSPLVPKDKIIGFFVYDSKQGIFKQDFIVDVNGEDKNFVLYTRFRGQIKSKRVRDIKIFFEKYGENIYYLGTHHPKFEDLPPEIRPRALEAIKLAERIKTGGLREWISKEEYDRFDSELKRLGL